MEAPPLEESPGENQPLDTSPLVTVIPITSEHRRPPLELRVLIILRRSFAVTLPPCTSALVVLLRKAAVPPNWCTLVTGGTADASGGDRWRNFAAAQSEGNAANTSCAEVCRALVDGSERAQELVSRFLPLGHEIPVDHLLSDAEVVQLPCDLLLVVIQLVHVSALLVVDAVDRPCCLMLPLPFVRFINSIFHPVVKHLKRREDGIPSSWRLLRQPLQTVGHYALMVIQIPK
mmetsp:Transcript_27119/g.55243  ORF Transcript_27119/g.55243 Transcript_27119/m.55243 type:complete len:232 (-) Transcript_27119:293-988(-)